MVGSLGFLHTLGRKRGMLGPMSHHFWSPARADPAPKPDEGKPKMPGAVPTTRHKPMPIDFGPVSGCFDRDPKLLHREIDQPGKVGVRLFIRRFNVAEEGGGSIDVTYRSVGRGRRSS